MQLEIGILLLLHLSCESNQVKAARLNESSGVDYTTMTFLHVRGQVCSHSSSSIGQS
jgi:hypothetical protein